MEVIKPETRGEIHLNVILYGVTGVGKTVFCGTANECKFTRPSLVVDVEGGTLSLSGQDVDVTRPKSFKDIQVIYDFLRNENTKYKSVCVDSLSEIQRKISMGEIMEDLDEEAAYQNLGKAVPPNRQDWLRSHEHMRKFIRAFRDLSYHPDEKRRLHVFMTALEKADETRSIVCPQLPGLLGVECGAYVDILARLSVQKRTVKEEEVEARHLLTQDYTDEDGTKYLAKNRGGKMGVSTWNPTAEKLVRKWVAEEVKS